MKKDLDINGGRWYIRLYGCNGWWRKTVLTVLRVWCGVICVFYRSRGVRWVMCMGRNVTEDVCFPVCIWKVFLIFYLAGCFVMGRWWQLIFGGSKEGIFLMSFMVPSVAPMYCLTELLVFKVALYTSFLYRHFPSWWHVFLTL